MATPTNVTYRRGSSGPVAGGRTVFSGQAGAAVHAAAALAVQKLLAAVAAAVAGASSGAGVAKPLGGAAAALATVSGALVVGGQFLWDSVADADGYRIYWGTSSGSYSQSPGAGHNVGLVTSYPLTSLSLSAGVTYYMVVRAYNENGEGASSNEIQVLNGVQVGP